MKKLVEGHLKPAVSNRYTRQASPFGWIQNEARGGVIESMQREKSRYAKNYHLDLVMFTITKHGMEISHVHGI